MYSGIPPTTSVDSLDLQILNGMQITQSPSWSELFVPGGPDLTSLLEAATSNNIPHAEARPSDSVSRVEAAPQSSNSVTGVGTESSDSQATVVLAADDFLNPDNSVRNFLPLIYSF
jgi:hypothetical protein